MELLVTIQNRSRFRSYLIRITTSEDKNHPWYGFTQYKKSFGGFEVDYSGTWDFPLNKRKYSLYKKIRKANRLLRKISK